jgi:hypothetical protein
MQIDPNGTGIFQTLTGASVILLEALGLSTKSQGMAWLNSICTRRSSRRCGI